jgi:hypothetical protein
MRPFVPNPNFKAEVEGQDEHSEGLKQVAESVKRYAEATARSVGAPWMPRSGHDTIEIGEDADGVYVANTDYGGHLMEYGGKNNPPHAPLRQGAQSAGLRVDE